MPDSLPPRFEDRTLVIIPARNEEECVGGVIQRLQAIGFRKIRVVANACTDATAEVARQLGAEALSHPKGGYGLACWLGAQNLPDGIDWLLFCNADASDDLEALPRFAQLSSEYDLILGSRLGREERNQMTVPQRFGNWLAPALIHLFWRRRFHDLGPQRAIRVSAFRRLEMEDRGFGWTVEMQVRAIEEKLRVVEIPVRSFPRPAGVSKISGNLKGSLMAGLIILSTLAKLAVRKRSTDGALESPATACSAGSK